MIVAKYDDQVVNFDFMPQMKRQASHLVRVKRRRAPAAPIFDTGLDPHEEVDVAVVFRVAEVDVVLDVDAGSQRRTFNEVKTNLLQKLLTISHSV